MGMTEPQAAGRQGFGTRTGFVRVSSWWRVCRAHLLVPDHLPPSSMVDMGRPWMGSPDGSAVAWFDPSGPIVALLSLGSPFKALDRLSVKQIVLALFCILQRYRQPD